MKRSPLAALGPLAVAAGLLASGCGGGDGDELAGTPPDQYASRVCGAISTWQNQLETRAGTMQSELRTSTTPAQVKTQLVAFMESATASTDQMLAKVEDAGPPAVEEGEALQRDLEAGLRKAQTAFAQARDKAKKLPTNDRAAFQREASQLGTTLSQQGSAISDTFSGLSTKYDSNELNAAFDNDPACRSL